MTEMNLRRFSILSLILGFALVVPVLFGIFSQEITSPVMTETRPVILKLSLEGPITPSSLDLLSEALDKAEERKARALIVSLDTPGGLMTSMDKMIRKILSSPVPVITYVSPAGAACGSAGVYILYSSHLAAMTPASNIGSATPVQMNGQGQGEEKKSQDIPEKAGADDSVNLKRKLINHSVAQIKSLAAYHGRDPVFAERSITFADNITSQEALKRKVIEIIAEDDRDLLEKADGKKVRMIAGTQILDLKDVPVESLNTDFRQNFLRLITDPNLAYILMMIGTLGIIAEVQYPGSIFPGVAGVICLILGLYSMHTLSLSYAGFGLILVGVICFILEVSIMSYGMLTIAGIISMIIGSIMLADSGEEMAKLSLQVALSTGLGVGGFSAWIAYKAVRSLNQKASSGDGVFLGLIGESITNLGPEGTGQVLVNGEIWEAKAQKIIPAGRKVKILARSGLVLEVGEPDS